MDSCQRCEGAGIYEDVYLDQQDCYLCTGTVSVLGDELISTQLLSVAYTLAYNYLCQFKTASLMGVENLSECVEKYVDGLSNLPKESQELLIAWNNQESNNFPYLLDHFNMEVWYGEDSDNLL